MWSGSVRDIFIAEAAGAPMAVCDAVTAIAGRGLEGDRYFGGRGFYSLHDGPIRELSLIEAEVLDLLASAHGLALAPGETRRNITTIGVPLGHLVGKRFQVGEAIVEGVEICEPCKHLVEVTGRRGILSALVHRGGLHAAIVRNGVIRPGDDVRPVDLHTPAAGA